MKRIHLIDGFWGITGLTLFGLMAACGGGGGGGSATTDSESLSLSDQDTGHSTSEDSESASESDTEDPSSGSAVDSETVVDTDTTPHACVVYVSLEGASSGGTGQGWDSPLGNLQDAIDLAALEIEGGAGRCEVWVAAGVYYIFETSMNDTLQMRSKVDLYGGFGQGELLRSERDVVANRTVLDGHRTATDYGNRVLHVVKGADDAVLDGFIVTGGYAAVSYDPADRDNYGGGMLCEKASPTVRNSWFVENEAMWDGAVALFAGSAPRFEDCVFSDNLTGGLFALNSSPVVDRCVFSGNRVSGLVANGKLAAPVVTSSVFAGNRDFGVESWYRAVVHLDHCTIAGNFPNADGPTHGGGAYAVQATVTLRSSIVFGNAPQTLVTEDGGVVSATYTLIDGLSGQGNFDDDPRFLGLPLVQEKTWDDVSFDPETGTTRLVDEDAAFDTTALAGRFLQPNADPLLPGGPVWVPVASVTSNTLTVVGDVSWLAAAGDEYALYDLNLGQGSPALGVADPKGTAPLDVTGKPRDESPDLGAYER